MAGSILNRYKRLLIIDDDVEDQEIFIEALKEVNSAVQCDTATSGEDAFKAIGMTDQLPDLIFLDLNMPKLNGKQVLRELKQRDKINMVPVIMYSTSFGPRDIDEIRELGAVHHLVKPSRFDELCKALSTILITDWRNPMRSAS